MSRAVRLEFWTVREKHDVFLAHLHVFLETAGCAPTGDVHRPYCKCGDEAHAFERAAQGYIWFTVLGVNRDVAGVIVDVPDDLPARLRNFATENDSMLRRWLVSEVEDIPIERAASPDVQ